MCLCLAGSGSFHASAASLIQPSGAITEEMLFSDDPKDWAQPDRVVPPEYPPEQFGDNVTGYVDVEVSIDASGKVNDSRIVKSSPENKAFEAAVSQTIRMWSFHRRISSKCEPIAAIGNVRVWFEIRDGRGVISVSGKASDLTTPDTKAPKRAVFINEKEVKGGMRFPKRAYADHAEADVFAVMSVDAATGDVRKVEISSIQIHGNSTGAAERFSEVVTSRLMLGKLAPRAGSAYKVCVPVSFRFT